MTRQNRGLGVDDSRGTRRYGHSALGLSVVLTFTVTLILGVYTVYAALPYNTIQLPHSQGSPIRTVLPQGWKFFTRNPTEPQLGLRLQTSSGNWVDGSLGQNASPRQLFGIRRDSRAQPSEAEALLRDVPASRWTDCEGPPERCLEASAPVAAVSNPVRDATLCGEVGFILQKPVPWAWARMLGDVVMPSRVVRLEVQCSAH
ncbi:SdpA family antimicrobial peptide system protein [Archangium gephyra]|uniref:SdpA family antimicrobial peptide system protein n=1 Tax=Archangium gephyra TaxID=48 RepID=UPI003B7F6DA0